MPTVPIVPTQELQGGGFQPFSPGSAVEPARNFSGQQAQEMGAKMVSAGQVLGSIASKMQDEMDDAATKQADVSFLERAQGILRGKNGYLNTLGAGAADVSGVNASLTEAQKEVEKGLTNDVQRLMFRQASARHMLTFKSQISEHRVTQTRQYAAGESKARADRYSLEAANHFDSIGLVDATGAPTGPYEVALRTALQEANAAADLSMLPADSEQRKAMVREVYGKVASGVVTNMMSAGRYLEAKSYIDKVVRENQVHADTALRLTNAVDSGYDKQRGIEIGDAIYNGQTVGGTPTEDDFRKAITTIVPGAQVTSVFRSQEKQDGLVASGATKAERSYHVPGTFGDGFQGVDVQPINGMEINDFVKMLRSQGLEVTDIVDESKKGGTGPHWHMAVKLPNQMVGAREGGVKVPPLADGKKDLANIEAAIKGMNLEPDQEAAALQTAHARYTIDQQREADAYKSLFEQATATAYARVGGWQDIDPVTWGKLKQEDKAKLMEQVRGSDPDTVLKFLDDPLLGKKGTIEQYRPLLSESDYQRFYAAANGPDAEAKVREATIDGDLFNASLIRNGQSALVNPKDDDGKQQLVEFRSKFKVLIDAEQTRLKRSLSITEKQAILDGMLIDKAFIDSWGSDASKPITLMSPDDLKSAYVVVGTEEVRLAQIPAGERAKIIEALKARGMPATEQAVAELWVKAGKPR